MSEEKKSPQELAEHWCEIAQGRELLNRAQAEHIARLQRKLDAAIHLLRQLGVHPDVVEGLSK